MCRCPLKTSPPLANYRPHLSHFLAEINFRDPTLVAFCLCVYLWGVEGEDLNHDYSLFFPFFQEYCLLFILTFFRDIHSSFLKLFLVFISVFLFEFLSVNYITFKKLKL